MIETKQELFNKIAPIKLLALDVDGVLTNGQIVYDSNGNQIHFFHVRDGLGIKLLMENGVDVAIISARFSKALSKRCEELGIRLAYQGVTDKLACLKGLLQQLNISFNEVGAMGDDLVDLSMLKQCRFSATVKDAPEVLLKHVDYITKAPGGYGAVREVCELILMSKGLWDKVVKGFS